MTAITDAELVLQLDAAELRREIVRQDRRGRPIATSTRVVNVRLHDDCLARYRRIAAKADVPLRTVLRFVLEMHAPDERRPTP